MLFGMENPFPCRERPILSKKGDMGKNLDFPWLIQARRDEFLKSGHDVLRYMGNQEFGIRW